jgi:diaminopimelate decarboxylase
MKLPFITHGELENLCRDVPTPFHLYDEAIIRKRANRLKAAFAWNPGFREYFAVKANPNPALLRIVMDEGCGLDCASHAELMLAEAVGARGHDVMFSSNVTPEVDMRLAVRMGSFINLDDISHIDFLDRLAGIPETISLRFNPGNEFTIGNSIMSRPGDAKYGFTRPQLSKGVRELKARGARRFGIHAFLSSNTTEAEYYPALARLLFSTAVELHRESGVDIAVVNLSGGIGVPYRPEDPEVGIYDVGQGVRAAFEEIMVPAGLGNTAIHTELGRWLLAPAGCLVSRVIHEKHIYKDYLGLDACAADLMRPALYGAYHHITVAGREDASPCGTWDVTGGLCENNDKFAIDRPLPEVGIGDLVVIHDTGGHGHSMGYNYNGKLRSAEVLRNESVGYRLIRRAETPADYFATLDVLSDFRWPHREAEEKGK